MEKAVFLFLREEQRSAWVRKQQEREESPLAVLGRAIAWEVDEFLRGAGGDGGDEERLDRPWVLDLADDDDPGLSRRLR